MKKPLAVTLVSGGMDSCVTAAVAATEAHPAFLHINYGQRTEARELEAFNGIADFYGVEQRLIVDLGYLKIIGGSALTDNKIEVPTHNSPQEIQDSEIPPTYVPFRNAHLLSVAVSWAEVIGAERIYIGAVEEDSSGYPDCREEFYRAFQRSVDEGTKPETAIEIVTPLIRMSKAEIVRRGVELGAPLNLTWSCYKDEDGACGVCDSCLLRLKGFEGAGVEDPIVYKRQADGSVAL
ncbi:MAG: 7-cyano-7-deazaguanine synthase QueC [Thermodesulfobacteriota bacterium]